jgi:hypothetical protein
MEICTFLEEYLLNVTLNEVAGKLEVVIVHVENYFARGSYVRPCIQWIYEGDAYGFKF